MIDGSLYDEPRKKLVTSTVEHAAVQDFATAREITGSSVIRIRVNEKGCLDLEKLDDSEKRMKIRQALVCRYFPDHATSLGYSDATSGSGDEEEDETPT